MIPITHCPSSIFRDECPRCWEKLSPAEQKEFRHCKSCFCPVFLCTSIQEYKYWRFENHGVAIADPALLEQVSQLPPDPAAPLRKAVSMFDQEGVKAALRTGMNPNNLCGKFKGDSLYDWAMHEYLFMSQLGTKKILEESTEEDRKTEDAWLAFLDRMAAKHEKQRPKCLIMLRMYGAKSSRAHIDVNDLLAIMNYKYWERFHTALTIK